MQQVELLEGERARSTERLAQLRDAWERNAWDEAYPRMGKEPLAFVRERRDILARDVKTLREIEESMPAWEDAMRRMPSTTRGERSLGRPPASAGEGAAPAGALTAAPRFGKNHKCGWEGCPGGPLSFQLTRPHVVCTGVPSVWNGPIGPVVTTSRASQVAANPDPGPLGANLRAADAGAGARRRPQVGHYR